MKVTDLMLNDLVLYRGEVVRVISLATNGDVWVMPNGHFFGVLASIDELSPITLTPEILEKNGFKECVWNGVDSWQIGNHDTFFCISGRNGGIMRFGYMGYESKISLWYFHELQHALKICGIKKEIVV
jgi:hypothetical protein